MHVIRSSRRAFATSLASTAASAGLVRASARAAQFELKCSTNAAAKRTSTVRQAQMWAAVEQESGGRVQVQFFPDSQLGNDTSTLAQTREGAIDFLFQHPGNLANFIPPNDITFLGFAFKDADEGFKALENSPLFNYLSKETLAKGLVVLSPIWDLGLIEIAGSRPIKVPDDMRGYKIRAAQSKITLDLFRKLGADPVPISPVDIYASLQTKLIDGESSPLIQVEASHFDEINKFVSITHHQWAFVNLYVNPASWQRIPPDLQAVIERNNAKYALQQRRGNTQDVATVIADLRKKGLGVNQVDQTPFRALLRDQSYYKDWQTTFGPTEWSLLESSLGHKLG